MQINRCRIHILTRCQGEKGSLSFGERHKHGGRGGGSSEGTGRKGGTGGSPAAPGAEAMGLQLLQCLCGALPWGEGPSAHGQAGFGVIPSPHACGGSRGGCGQGEVWKEQGQLVVRL